MRRPYYMDAPKAKEFGVIDKVILSTVNCDVDFYLHILRDWGNLLSLSKVISPVKFSSQSAIFWCLPGINDEYVFKLFQLKASITSVSCKVMLLTHIPWKLRPSFGKLLKHICLLRFYGSCGWVKKKLSFQYDVYRFLIRKLVVFTQKYIIKDDLIICYMLDWHKTVNTFHQILWRGQEKIIADVVPSEEFDKNAGIRSVERV